VLESFHFAGEDSMHISKVILVNPKPHEEELQGVLEEVVVIVSIKNRMGNIANQVLKE
jgi:hypothetical protein